MAEAAPVGIGLALGGGGLRGAAHVGVLHVLAEHRVPVAAVSGTSAGAVVAALWGAGWTPDEMEALARRVRWEDLYDYTLGFRRGLALALHFVGRRVRPERLPQGLIAGERLERLLQRWTRGARFEDLRFPLAIMAADLASGRPVVFCGPRLGERLRQSWPEAVPLTGEPVAAAVRASLAVPGIFAPRVIGERTLVDGAVTDKVPVAVLQALGIHPIVAVDVSHPLRPAAGLLGTVAASFQFMSAELARLRLSAHADLVLRPNLPWLSLRDLDRVAECVQEGRRTAEEALPAIRRLLASVGGAPSPEPQDSPVALPET